MHCNLLLILQGDLSYSLSPLLPQSFYYFTKPLINSNPFLTASLYTFFTFFTCSNQHLSPSHLTSISPVFSNEWFGAVDENNHIMNSRYDSSPLPRCWFLIILSHHFFVRHWLNSRSNSWLVLPFFSIKAPFLHSSFSSFFPSSPLLKSSFSTALFPSPLLDGPTLPCQDRQGTVCATATVSFAHTGIITRIKVSSVWHNWIRLNVIE